MVPVCRLVIESLKEERTLLGTVFCLQLRGSNEKNGLMIDNRMSIK